MPHGAGIKNHLQVCGLGFLEDNKSTDYKNNGSTNNILFTALDTKETTGNGTSPRAHTRQPSGSQNLGTGKATGHLNQHSNIANLVL